MPKKGEWLMFKALFGAGMFDDEEIAHWKVRLEAKIHRLRGFLAVIETNASLDMEAEALDLAIKSLSGDLGLAHSSYMSAATNDDKAGRSAAIDDFKDVEARAKRARLTYEPLAKQTLLADPSAATALPEGKALADRLVKDINTVTGGQQQKALLAALIKGRFGLDRLPGDPSLKKLKASYTLMALMPESHTRDNSSFKVLELLSGETEGYYVEREQKAVVVSRDVDPLHSSTYVPSDTGDTVPAAYQHKGRSLNTFNHTLLHEIGHAVDTTTATMKNNGKQAAYGGWETVDEHTVGLAFAEEHGLCAAFPDLPGELLRFYAVYCVDEGDAADSKLAELWAQLAARASKTPKPEEMVKKSAVADALALYAKYEDPDDLDHVWPADPAEREAIMTMRMLQYVSTEAQFGGGDSLKSGMTAAYRNACSLMFRRGGGQAPEAAFLSAAQEAIRAIREDFKGPLPDLTAVKAHRAIQLCKEYCDLEGLWQQGGAGARRFTAGRWVYSRSSERIKLRYLASERQKAVTLYQWNAPGEWFAELYALYMADNLKPTHPAVPLFLSNLGEPLSL